MQDEALGTKGVEGSFTSADALVLRNIMLATDFSECSSRALHFALGIAARYGATLHLFHCIDPTPYNMGAPEAVQPAREAAWRDMQRLDVELRHSGLAKDVEVKLHVEVDELQTILPALVSDLNLGLLIVGTHGRTGWKKVVLGSVAESVVDHARCPVLTVGPSTDRHRLEHFGPESILFARNAFVHSKLAESYAFSLAGKYHSRLTVADVLEDHAGRVLAQVSLFEWRESEAGDVSFRGRPTNLPQMPTETGTQSDMILGVADRSAADLIVLTVPGSYRFTDRFFSTNSYQVVCGARCPVLTVRTG